ncbi:MAG TPA: RNA polymerase sigma factor [Pyrinomonadaceae bacterium]|nr:RNA polymerase sigma factor [Pyrinomonadaceae bacterium]
MLDQRRVAAQPDENRERLFTERYQGLLAWALRLTKQNRESAEDLVQDAFVQFVLGRSRLEDIENIDGYLRRMLRYMHCSRMSRSAQRLHETALSLADYDSFRLGWTAIEPARRMQASEELYQICAYACSRKESSRAGSVLILRFFHNYFPTEIAGVLNSSRTCVDQWQRIARREAKLFMNRPGRLAFVNAKAPAGRHPAGYLPSDCDLMHELQQVIFNSRQGECIAQEELEQVYKNNLSDALTTAKLAHIVSCPLCLDTVNSLLGLPLLAQRYQPETHEPKEPPTDNGDGPSGGSVADLTKKFGNKLRETREHKPHELRISVNGFLVSSLKVRSDLSELNLNLTPDEPIEFVEVSSEQGVRLLFFALNPAVPDGEQWSWIELSEGRSLEACFRNEDGPSLHVVYRDPEPEESFSTTENFSTALSSPLFVVPAGSELDEQKVANQSVVFHLRSRTRRLTEKLCAIWKRRIVARESQLSMNEGMPLFAALVQSRYTARRQSWSLLVMLVSAVVIGAFLFFRSSLSTAVTASMLLEKASAAEQSTGAAPDLVRHRFINLEERRSTEGAVVARRKIEVWENRANGNRAQRLYDDSNRLIAGVWQTSNGARTVYHHGSKPQTQQALAAPESLLLNVDDIWQLEPSARSFSALIAEPADATVEEQASTYVLRYEKDRAIGASHLLKATLTLSKSDFHSIEQTLLVQRGSELREYRFAEASFELVPVKAVAPAVFGVEPELTGGAGETGRPGDWALRDLTSSRVPPSPSTSTPPAASAELEVDVAYLLNQAKADRNEQVALTRSAGGSLRVEGVVDSQERKQEFLRALSPVSANPAVKIDIRTVAEATQRTTVAGAVAVQETDETNNTVAVDEELRAYFSTREQAASVDLAIQSYSSRVVNRAYRALFHAIELKRLINRFANVDMRTITPDARAKWLAMLHEHAAAFARENAALREQIQPIFFPGTVLKVDEDVLIQSDADLARVVEQMYKLALSNNEAIRSAFTISSQSSVNAFKSTAFQRSIQRVEKLAERIGQYQTTSN